MSILDNISLGDLEDEKEVDTNGDLLSKSGSMLDSFTMEDIVPPKPKTPFTKKKFDLPDWVDRKKWDSAVNDLETSLYQFFDPEKYSEEPPGLITEYTRMATNPVTIAEGLTEFAMEVPGFFGGVLGGARDLVLKIFNDDADKFLRYLAEGPTALVDMLVEGDVNFLESYDAAAKGFQKERTKINDLLPMYRAKGEGSELVGETVMAPASAIMLAGHELADSEMVDELPQPYRDQTKGLLKFGGDVLGLLAQGKAMRASKVKGSKQELPSPSEADMLLDSTFAKDQVLQRIAMERAAVKQRPLNVLARKEESLKSVEMPPGERVRGKKVEGEYVGEKVEAEISQQESKPTDIKKDTVRIANQEYRPKSHLPDSPHIINAKGDIGVDYNSILDRATEKVGKKVESEVIPQDTAVREYGLKITDRNIPEAKKLQAQAIVNKVQKEGRTAEAAATIFDEFLRDNQSLKGKVELSKRLREEQDASSVPDFKNTNEAIEFGEKATKEQVSEMEQIRAQNQLLIDELMSKRDFKSLENIIYKNQFVREAIEASDGVHPHQLRKAKDIAKDVVTLVKDIRLKPEGLGSSLGNIKLKKPTQEQLTALDSLSKDILVIKRNASRAGKSVSKYLTDLGHDPMVVEALSKGVEKFTEHAATTLGQEIVSQYERATTQERGKYAGSVNLEKQNIPESAKVLESVIAKPKQTITWKDTELKSDKIILNSKKLNADYKRLKKIAGGKLTADIDAAREVNAKAMTMFGDILEKHVKGEISVSELNERFQGFNRDIFQIASDASSEIGRALQVHKKEVAPNRIAKALSRIEKDLNPRQIEELSEITRKLQEGTLTPDELSIFLRRLPDPRIGDYITEFWYNSILSGPPTHVVNIAGNTLWTMFQLPHRALSGVVDSFWSTLTGKKRSRFVHEVIPMMLGYKKGFRTGKIAAKEMFTKGVIESFDTKWAQEIGSAYGAFERSPNSAVRKLAPWLTVATKGLRAMDVWAKAIAFDGQSRALARRESIRKGLSGDRMVEFEKEFLENFPDWAFEDAKRFADYSTFMDLPDPLTNLIIKTRNVPVVGTAARLTIMPFVNTISNLTKRGLEMTPGIGLAKVAAAKRMKSGIENMPEGTVKSLGKKWAEQKEFSAPDIIAKQIEGAIMAYFVLQLASDGKITGSLPDNPAERDSWYRQNKKPWAVKVGDSWYEYRRVEPFNTVIAAASTAYDKIKNATDDDTRTEIFEDFTTSMVENVLDGSYFEGLQSVMDKHGGRGRLLSRSAAGFVPYSGFWRSINRAVEVLNEGSAKVREGNEWLRSFSQVIPGLSGKMPVKLDVWGNESVYPGGVFRQWLPFKWAEQVDDKVERELEKLDIYPSLPRQKIKIKGEDFEIPDDLYREFCIYYGKNLKEKFDKKINARSWDRMGDRQKTIILKKLRNGVYKKSRSELMNMLRSKRNG